MRINAKKSCCLRIGPIFNATCTCVITSDGHSEMRYLVIHFVQDEIRGALFLMQNVHSIGRLMPYLVKLVSMHLKK